MRLLRAANARGPADSCDAEALARDLDDLCVLLRERHIAFGTGELVWEEIGPAIEQLCDGWRQRLSDEAPTTWGEAIGVEFDRLRRLLGDRHCAMQGEDRELVAKAANRGHPIRFSDDGPKLEEGVYMDVLYFRIRGFFGDVADLNTFEAWANDHGRHFGYDRIVVDLRGNPGGSDEYAATWIRPHVRTAASYEQIDWSVDGAALWTWDAWVTNHALYGDADERTMRMNARRFKPTPETTRQLSRVTEDFPIGPDPWDGQMLVIIDNGAASSAESTAIWLRDCLGARVVGSPSAGATRFGNLGTSILPRSGAMMLAGTSSFHDGITEFAGIQTAAPLTNPFAEPATIAASFAEIWDAAAPPA